MPIDFKPATVENSAEISALCCKEIKKYISASFPLKAHQHLMNIMSENSFKDLIQNSAYRVTVALEDDKVVGVVTIKNFTHLYALYVDDDFKRQGIAKTLWEQVKGECLNRSKLKEFTVNSSEFAVEFYEKQGFIRYGDFETEQGVKYLPMVLKI